MDQELRFICHRWYLISFVAAGMFLAGWGVYSYFFDSVGLWECLFFIVLGLACSLTIVQEAPQLIFRGGKLVINRWLFKREYELSEIKEINAGTVLTDQVNKHNGIYIVFKSGKVFKNVCAPEYMAAANEYLQNYKA